jgi:1-acyl-sn-glycerol-3-phosphate acyltransferase
MMRKGSAAIYPGTAHIHFLPAIDPTAYATRDALMAAVHAAIAAALPPEMQPEAGLRA